MLRPRLICWLLGHEVGTEQPRFKWYWCKRCGRLCHGWRLIDGRAVARFPASGMRQALRRAAMAMGLA